ncbi:MAG: hypothetical protein ACLS61_11225 [Ruminococcus sp.]
MQTLLFRRGNSGTGKHGTRLCEGGSFQKRMPAGDAGGASSGRASGGIRSSKQSGESHTHWKAIDILKLSQRSCELRREHYENVYSIGKHVAVNSTNRSTFYRRKAMRNTAKIRLTNRIRKLLSDKRGFSLGELLAATVILLLASRGYDAGNGFCHPDV